MLSQSTEWNLNQWLEVLETRHKQEIQLGLPRVLEVAQRMDLLNLGCKVITVGGTNGKGSTVSALETMYHCAGFKVGAYTSPHLLQFNERIRVDMVNIADGVLCKAFCCIEEARHDTVLSYFETTTLAALWYFKQNQLDVVILEVGLGGRLDATNIIDADLSIITTIDYDHQEFLGNTLESIGFEKAGIIRPNKPFIYADLNPPATVLEAVKNQGAIGYYFEKDYQINDQGETWEFQSKGTKSDCILEFLPRPKIQLKSAAAAIMACSILDEFLPVQRMQINTALTKIFILGRLQFFPGRINFLFDVSHNPQSATLLAEYLSQLKIKGCVHAVFSALKDKDILGIILPLKDCVDHWYVAQLDNKRAASKDLLLSQFEEAQINSEICYNSPLTAFNEAIKQAKQDDLIVVFGSFMTVGQIMTNQNALLMLKEMQ